VAEADLLSAAEKFGLCLAEKQENHSPNKKSFKTYRFIREPE
jgi:hypothetical protein